MEFAYMEIDAAYVWTHGGYQIARSHDDYPVFIDVHGQDVDRWISFYEQYGIDTAIDERPDASDMEGDIYYVLFPTAGEIETEWIDGNPVILLDETVEQMTDNRPAYEPALEIITEEYDMDIDASYHDQMTVD